jgi:hypothetical protein
VIAHIVLLQPRADLTAEQRQNALETLARAATDVPEILSVRVGRRVRHGLPGYEQAMTQDYEFALIIEVEDPAALVRYLNAPAHQALGALFSEATSAAIAYDYEMSDGLVL